ncbi:MAG: hypothetical protein E7658_06100 [Ruminococcaceae bacterium]|nr:hypothetical protein [Oscillospiraceae bacterium]
MFSAYFESSAFRDNPFVFRSEMNILLERDIGIAGEKGTVLTPPEGAAVITRLENCPWSATGLSLEARIDGERIQGRDWTWLPNGILRQGKAGNWQAKTLTMLPPGRNGCILCIEFTNISDTPLEAPLQITVGGGLASYPAHVWGFDVVPHSGYLHFASLTTDRFDKGKGTYLKAIGHSHNVAGEPYAETDPMCIIGCTEPDMSWFANAELLETTRTVKPGESWQVAVCAVLGGQTDDLVREAEEMMADPEKELEAAFAWLKKDTERIFAGLPHFTSDNPALNALYYRSLVTYCLNRWENPNYYTTPFYSTGSVTGGCMCSYLWDYAGGIMLHPLVDSETNKKMIRSFLHVDLCKSFAILPLDGAPTGPWYHINQEKVLGMIYYQVLLNGDTAFLEEVVDGRTILEWALFHAGVGDDLSKPAVLMDYGDGGKSHLELRREYLGYVYKGVMPDLNARRYRNFLFAYAISVMGGKPEPILLERAAELKKLLPELWDDEAGWYDFIWKGERQKRYTVQMYKFLSSGVIDKPVQEKLIAHLNDTEFLSRYGLHSISKLDPAYDQIDIDNGGGGICTLFTMQVVLQLYEIGYEEMASDILSRVLWWGTRLPYMGDSCAANMLMQRVDTPLQAGISSVSCAQTIVFGVCGIHVRSDGSVYIKPPKVFPAGELELKDVKIRGLCFSVEIRGGKFTVRQGEEAVTKDLGESLELLPPVQAAK